MELAELMIGDYVKIRKANKYRRIRGTNDMLFYDYYEHIPLTEEILEKNDFDRQPYDDGNPYWWAVFDGWFNINLDHKGCIEGGFSCVQYRDLVINSVHQLQHLLRLVGVQKEIEP